jgi:hypothetical protein
MTPAELITFLRNCLSFKILVYDIKRPVLLLYETVFDMLNINGVQRKVSSDSVHCDICSAVFVAVYLYVQ